jgi:hypothetical protein
MLQQKPLQMATPFSLKYQAKQHVWQNSATHPKIAATALSRIIATKSATCSTCSGFFDPSLQVRMRVCARDTRISEYSQVIISGYGIHQFSGLTEATSPGITRACAHIRA